MIVLDSNVVSELMRPAPASAVTGWVRAHRGKDLYTTSITLAEVRYGIERLPGGRRKDLLRATADDVFSEFDDQVLPFDVVAANEYSDVVSGRDRLGRPIDGFDAQIASICRAHGAALATRNIKDFEHTRIEILDPWVTQ